VAALLLGKQQMTGAFGNGKILSGGMSKKDALKSSKFYLATAVMCIISCASCVSQQLPALLESLGHSNTNALISVMTAFVAVGTVAEGLVCSRIGIQKIVYQNDEFMVTDVVYENLSTEEDFALLVHTGRPEGIPFLRIFIESEGQTGIYYVAYHGQEGTPSTEYVCVTELE